MERIASADPRVGTELAGYRIEALVGRGGMGVVYRAGDLALERKVALKLLVPELAADADFRQRFLVESRLAASIDHSNIVPIHDAGEAEGLLYIAMRYVASPSRPPPRAAPSPARPTTSPPKTYEIGRCGQPGVGELSPSQRPRRR